MTTTPYYSIEQARDAGIAVGVDWDSCGFTQEGFRAGMCVERERALRDDSLDAGDLVATAERVHENLFQFPDYYTEQDMLEAAYDEYWSERGI